MGGECWVVRAVAGLLRGVGRDDVHVVADLDGEDRQLAGVGLEIRYFQRFYIVLYGALSNNDASIGISLIIPSQVISRIDENPELAAAFHRQVVSSGFLIETYLPQTVFEKRLSVERGQLPKCGCNHLC